MSARVIVTKTNSGAFLIVAEDSDGRLFQTTVKDRNAAMVEALARLGRLFDRRWNLRERRGVTSLL